MFTSIKRINSGDTAFLKITKMASAMHGALDTYSFVHSLDSFPQRLGVMHHVTSPGLAPGSVATKARETQLGSPEGQAFNSVSTFRQLKIVPKKVIFKMRIQLISPNSSLLIFSGEVRPGEVFPDLCLFFKNPRKSTSHTLTLVLSFLSSQPRVIISRRSEVAKPQPAPDGPCAVVAVVRSAQCSTHQERQSLKAL